MRYVILLSNSSNYSKLFLSFQFEYQKFPFNARNSLFIGLEPIGYMLLVCTSFVLIVLVLIPLVQEKENGVKVSHGIIK